MSQYQNPNAIAPAGQSSISSASLLPPTQNVQPTVVENVPFPDYWHLPGQRRTLCGYGACDPSIARASNQFVAFQSSRIWIESNEFAAGGDILFADTISVDGFVYGVGGATSTSGDATTQAGNSTGRPATLADTSALANGTMASSKNCQFLIFGFFATPESVMQYATDNGDFHSAWLSPKSFDYYERTMTALSRNLHVSAVNEALGCRYQLRTLQELPGLPGVRGADQIQYGQLTGVVPMLAPIAWICSGSDVNNNQVILRTTLPVSQTIQNVAANPTVLSSTIGGNTDFTGVVATFKLHAVGMTVGLNMDAICGPTLG